VWLLLARPYEAAICLTLFKFAHVALTVRLGDGVMVGDGDGDGLRDGDGLGDADVDGVAVDGEGDVDGDDVAGDADFDVDEDGFGLGFGLITGAAVRGARVVCCI
jgi:hypothetical protein